MFRNGCPVRVGPVGASCGMRARGRAFFCRQTFPVSFRCGSGEPNETATMCPPRVRPPPVRDGSARPIRFPAGCTRTRPTFRRPSPGGFGKAVSCIGSVRPRREGRGKDFGPGLRKRIAPAGNLSCGGETSYRVRTSARTAGFSVPAVRPSSVPDRRPKRSRCTVRPQRSVLRRI